MVQPFSEKRCSLCSSVFKEYYAKFSNEKIQEIYACSRKCFIVFQTHMRADELEKHENDKIQKKVTFSDNVKVIK